MSARDYSFFYAARKQLGLDEETWRALLVRVTGENSLRKMRERQLLALMTELRRLGFKPKAGGQAGKPLPASDKRFVKFIFRLWASCHEKGIISDGSRLALRCFVENDLKRRGLKAVSDPNFLTQEQASPIIEALKAMEARGTP